MVLAHLEWMLRILVATLCGMLIGYERSSKNKEAGLRTHSIICLGACLIAITSVHGFADNVSADRARIAAQIVSGIGFLGAGIIFVRHGTISGLTTAAGMWTTAGVGCTIGMGLYDIGIFTTFLMLMIQIILHKGVFERIDTSSQPLRFELYDTGQAIQRLMEDFDKFDIGYEIYKVEYFDNDVIQVVLETTIPGRFDQNEFISYMIRQDYVKTVSFR